MGQYVDSLNISGLMKQLISLSIHTEASVLVSPGIGVDVPDSRNTLPSIWKG